MNSSVIVTTRECSVVMFSATYVCVSICNALFECLDVE